MKNVKLLGYLLMMVAGSGQVMGGAPIPDQIINLVDLSDSVVQDFTQGKLSDTIIECMEGTMLPFIITVKGEFLSMESASIAPLYLKVLKTCYVRCEEKENFLFSTDLKTWKGFSEFFTGELKVTVRADNAGPVAGIEFELNQQ